MATDKVLALAREAGMAYAPQNPKIWSALIEDIERFAALLQQQMGADMHPVAWAAEGNLDIHCDKATLLRAGWKEEELTPLYAIKERK